MESRTCRGSSIPVRRTTAGWVEFFDFHQPSSEGWSAHSSPQPKGYCSRKQEYVPKEFCMQSSRSLQQRAALALLLMVGFYVFALAIAGALLWVPYAEVTYMERINGRLTFFCIV